MKNRYPLLGGLAALALGVALTGCDPGKDKPADNGGSTTTTNTTTDKSTTPPPAGAGKYKLITNGISPFWNSMGKGLDQAKADLKVNGDWQAPSPADHNAQVRIFKDALAQKVDGIGISVIEADAMTPTIDEAVGQGRQSSQ